MVFMPVMWTVWGVLVVAAAILHIYRENLSKNEENQIFLDDSFDNEKNAQAVIVAKVNRVEPILKLTYWLVAAMTAVVIFYYVHDILAQLGIMH